MFKKVIPLIDAALVFISKPVAYGLRKRADKNPKFHQFIVKKGQKFHFGDAPVVEEKAIQNAAKAIVVFTMAGTAVVYQWIRTQQRRYRRVFDLLNQEERSEVELQWLVKIRREIREEEQKMYDKMWRIKAVKNLLSEAERVQLEAVNDQNKTKGCRS